MPKSLLNVSPAMVFPEIFEGGVLLALKWVKTPGQEEELGPGF